MWNICATHVAAPLRVGKSTGDKTYENAPEDPAARTELWR